MNQLYNPFLSECSQPPPLSSPLLGCALFPWFLHASHPGLAAVTSHCKNCRTLMFVFCFNHCVITSPPYTCRLRSLLVGSLRNHSRLAAVTSHRQHGRGARLGTQRGAATYGGSALGIRGSHQGSDSESNTSSSCCTGEDEHTIDDFT